MDVGASDFPAEAMDRMMRNRGQAGSTRDSDHEAHATEPNYEAALGQTSGGSGVAAGRTTSFQGDASPGTLEQGGVALPVASPFHSERVQTEVELLRLRPVTLDQDAQRVGANAEDIGLGEDFSGVRSREPPYEQESPLEESQVRVARLEQVGDDVQRAGETRLAEGNRVSGGILERPGFAAVEAIPPSTTEISATPLPATMVAGDALSERSRLSVAGSGSRPTESLRGQNALGDRPLPGDTRELVPALGTVAGSTELLLMQVLQENRFLKVRIEQMESQSSWHSGRTPTTPMETEHIPQGSPVSLANPCVSAPVAELRGRVTGDLEMSQFGGNTLYQQPDGLIHGGAVQNRASGEAQNVQTLQAQPLDRIPDQGLGFQGVVGQGLYGGGIGVTNGLKGVEYNRGPGITGEGAVEHLGFNPAHMAVARPVPIAGLPPAPSHTQTPTIPSIPISKAIGGVRPGDTRHQELSGVRSVGSGDFQTPRDNGTGVWGLSADGYPVSPGGTIIKPPPLPPPRPPAVDLGLQGAQTVGFVNLPESVVQPTVAETPYPKPDNRPEEPAKYINELPKLPASDITTSAVACGNWLAQLRQIFAGLSPSAVDWWQAVELAASRHYQRWLIADPLDRLSLDPSGVVAVFDEVKFQRVESRAVSLILAAIPQYIRDEAVSNRWLSSAALLFRLQCVYQPGGASERSMLLSQLTVPESVNTVKAAVTMLRKWQQNFYRVRELGASMPDPSLLLSGIDKATSALLAQHHSLGFRVNAFRHKVALDYNPTVPSIVQLVRLLQAECEASSLSNMENTGPDKKARAAAARAESVADTGIPKTSVPSKPEDPQSSPSAKALEGHEKGSKGKGKGKGKGGASDSAPCHAFAEGKGCKFGDSCRFKHDRATARKQRRCLACGQDGHFRPECPLVAPEDRQVVSQSDASNPSSPKAPSKANSPSKPKAGPQTKGLIEDSAATPSGSAGPAVTSEGSARAHDTLLAEAAKLLKGVSLKHVSVTDIDDELQEWGIDRGWLISAVNSASDGRFALIDSGATNALRPAVASELESARRIKVDLASGGTHLHINEHGTLLSAQPCQVILPAGYLVCLGYSIVWKKKGCIIKRKHQPPLDVTIVKGCPLVSREQGLQLLAEYEALQELGQLPQHKTVRLDASVVIPEHHLRSWLASRVASGKVTRADQLLWLRSMFPDVPEGYLDRVAGQDIAGEGFALEGVPWNRRKRRTIARAKSGQVLLHLFSGVQKWQVPGIVLEVDKSKGADLLQANVYQHLLGWAVQGVFGGVVGGPPCRTISRCRSEDDGGPPPVRERGSGRWGLAGLPGDLAHLVEEDSVLWLRFLFLHALSQASADGPPEAQHCQAIELALQDEPVIPSDITTPLELAKWALQRAAERLKQQEEYQQPSSSYPTKPHRRVLFAWEHPRDPGEYADLGKAPTTGYVSIFTFLEWQRYADMYGIHLARFDQGCLGHRRPKPTMLGTTSWYLYEQLDGRFLTPEQRLLFGKGPQSRNSRISETPSWAMWAPGLTRLVQASWSRWYAENGVEADAEARQIMLARMSAEKRWQLHEANDHVPYMRGCPVCIASQGRQRSHWRSSCTSVHSASFDLAGPFVPGRAFDPIASGRDRGQGYKYFLACAFTMPVTASAASETAGPVSGAEMLEPEGLEPVDGIDVSAPVDGGPADAASDDGAGVAFHLDKVTTRVRGKRPEDPDVDSHSPVPPHEEPPLPPPPCPPSTRTLFMGTPLRSKHAKEVVPAVQAMINRLESYGFPVHRYHADRAKELRTHTLVSWLRDRGIHPTWTPGDAPAGNKAELAVQNLKGFVRKLLHLAELPVTLWPLALNHASRRNWVMLCEAVGIPQPSLLPFGVKLQARQRLRTGFDAQWSTRTIEALYLGHAPDTPGGHLVLVGDPSSEPRVLLTNTVYPLASNSHTPNKPKYRIYGKKSPELVFREVGAAALFPAQSALVGSVSRLSPGGEWDDGSTGTGGGSESGDESGVCPVREEVLGDVSQSIKGVQRPQVGIGVEELPGASTSNEELLNAYLEEGRFDFVDCLHVLRNCVGRCPSPIRQGLEGEKAYAVLGLFCQGGLRGVTRYSRSNGLLTKYLNKFVGVHNPEGVWASLYLSRNTNMVIHRDARNDQAFPTWIVSLGNPTGGGLWVGDGDSIGPILRQLPDGKIVSGYVLDTHNSPKTFNGSHWHEPQAWVGEDRWVLVGYVPKGFQRCTGAIQSELLSLGFPVEGLLFDGSSATSHLNRISSVKFKPGSVSLAESGVAKVESEGPAVTESWFVDVPHELWESCDMGVEMHSASLMFCLQMAQELHTGLSSGQGDRIVDWVRAARLEVSWWEGVLTSLQPQLEPSFSPRSARVDVPLAERPPEADEIFLQTRSIPLDQVRRELPLWAPAARDEVDNLENVMQAVERVTTRDIDRWIARGDKVLQIPGKAVTSRKSGTGRRKFRAVACGNYLESSSASSAPGDSLYASGVDSSTVRLAIAHAASHADWTGVVADVKCAFLHAPRRQTNVGEIWVIRPPHLLVELGVLQPCDRWKINKAIYGLRSSPRDWQVHRDAVLRDLEIPCDGKVFLLVQAKSDESLWILRRKGGGPIDGTMIVYVDDLVIFAVCALASAVLATIQKVWELSQPEWISEAGPVKFCGLEICRFGSGYRVNQQSYIEELLLKHGVKDDAAVPLARWSEPEADEQPSPEEVKSAQAITGALLWLSTRSRPDIAYSAARMSQYATRTPKLVLSIGNQVLRYLRGTATLALEYRDKVQYDWASHGQLPKLRDDSLLELYSDASHGPSGGRSMQASIVLWRGCLILWEATRQPFITLSSAESELVSMVNTISQGEAMQVVVEELLETSTHLLLLGDNAASVRSFEIADASWRNRHLRLRAASGREKIEAGLLTVAHLPGDFQVADIATKPLPRQRLLQLLDLACVRLRSEDAPVLSRVRALRRLSWEAINRIVVSPATLLVIAVLSSPVPAKAESYLGISVAVGSVGSVAAQPELPEVTFNMFTAMCGFLLLLVVFILSWFRDSVFNRGIRSSLHQHEARLGPEEQVLWDPLREREERTGLTLVQRARLRKQLQEGGIVEPPVMYQRFGSLPLWLTGHQEQDGGSAGSGHQVQDGGSSGSGPQIQIGGSSGSSDPMPQLRTGDLNAQPALVADRRDQEIESTEPSGIFRRPSAGDFDSGSLDSFSRFIYAVGGRRVIWKLRNELTNVLRNMLTIAGELIFGYLGDGSRELGYLGAVGPTFQSGVVAGIGRLRVLGFARSQGTDVARAYIQAPNQQERPDEDFNDDPSLDDIPHMNPPLHEPILGLVPLVYHVPFPEEDSGSEESQADVTTSSVSSVVPSEPEHEPSLPVSSSAVGSSEVPVLRASIPICYGQIQYRAEEEYLLVMYVDDVLRVPLPGWPREDIQAIVQGLSGDWTTFSAIIERDGALPINPPEVEEVPPSIPLSNTLLALEDATSVPAIGHSAVMSPQQLLTLALSGFIAGLSIGLCGLVGIVGLEPGFLGLTSWVILGWLCSVWYRSVRCLFILLWDGSCALPSSIGFATEPAVSLQSWASTCNTQRNQNVQDPWIPAVWLVLILLFGLVNPNQATELTASCEPQGSLDPHGVVISSQAICKVHAPSNSVTGYGAWWLVVIGCVGVVGIWESAKLAVRCMCCSRKTALSQVQTDDLPLVIHPLPGGVRPLPRVLFSLWRANLDVPIELYPEEVQQEYFGFLGSYLRRQAQGEDSSD